MQVFEPVLLRRVPRKYAQEEHAAVGVELSHENTARSSVATLKNIFNVIVAVGNFAFTKITWIALHLAQLQPEKQNFAVGACLNMKRMVCGPLQKRVHFCFFQCGSAARKFATFRMTS